MGTLVLQRRMQALAFAGLLLPHGAPETLILGTCWVISGRLLARETDRIVAVGTGAGSNAPELAAMRRVTRSEAFGAESRIFGASQWWMRHYEDRWRALRQHFLALRRRDDWKRLAAHHVVLVGAGAWATNQIVQSAMDTNSPATVLAIALPALIGLADFGLLGEEQWRLRQSVDFEAHMARLDEHLHQGTTPVGDRQLSSIAPSVDFQAVSYTYPASSAPAVHDFSLHVPAGTAVGIVGLNGAGKSTLLKLLQGLLASTTGHVLIDRVPVQAYAPDALPRALALMSQNPMRLPGSVEDNILLGLPRDEARLEHVRAVVGLTGPEWDQRSRAALDGDSLSGGQWQRVFLARAAYRALAGATLMVLDEPTSALDADSELAVLRGVLACGRSATKVVVSHRLNAIRECDHIVVLSDGQLVEQGPHAELMRRGGAYAELFALQSGAYTMALSS
jgi:ABC-type multidrug transport system fused ATPase/permease subunit